MINSTVSKIVLTALFMAPAMSAHAEEGRRAVHLQAQPLGDALRWLGRDRGREILFSPQAVAGRMAPAIDGVFTTDEALAMMLQGSGLIARSRRGAILIVERDPSLTRQSDPQAAVDDTIIVTGSRISGSPIASRVLQIGRDDIVTGGFGDLGGALRALPQNFAGGQNPGVGSGASAGGLANQNITGGSQVNLRGLGGDATLTLLNGNRLAYGGFSQGVDVSAIPIDAIDRIDVVPDGASAIYGSDAVAGVVNVILRKPFDGLTARARLGKATDGGDFTQDYALTGGKTWRDGGIFASYNYRHNTPIQARQRDYTAELGEGPYMLLPTQGTHSGLVRATQDLGHAIHLSLDGLFSARDQTRKITSYGSLGVVHLKDRIVSIAPGVDVDVGAGWTVSLRGVLSRDRTTAHDETSSDGTTLFTSTVCYCNSLASTEVSVGGALVSLPGGAVKLVAGGGHRANRFRNTNLISGNSIGGTQRDTYVYGELFVPLVSADNAAPLLRALSISLAGRYDHYNAFGGITTPKLGIIYRPAEALELKFSWGRSFKAPTLLQQLQGRSATLIEAATLIGSDAPAGASALYTGGGAPDLDAERATSMSWTAAFQPASNPDLRLELTYFRVRYSDRVVQPIGNFLDALNPVYAGYIVRNPTPQQVAQAVASSDSGVDTFGNVTRDLSKVAYIIDNHYTNVAAQKIQGIDAGLSYKSALGKGQVTAALNATWLDSRQQNESASAYFDLSGTIWNPARYRARATLGWEGGSFKAFGYLNYTGQLMDRRTPVTAIVPSTVTADLFLGYAVPASSGALRNLTLSLAIENLFNTKPPYLRAAPYVEAYDSTNYSPVGRFVAVSLSKSL